MKTEWQTLAQVAIGEVEGAATLHVPTHNLMCCSLFPVPYANCTSYPS